MRARFALLALACALAPPASAAEPWVAVWAASPATQPAPANGALKPLADQTLRQRLKVGIAGRRLQVTLTNAYGSKPLTVGAASVGRLIGGKLDPASIRPLTFGGKPSIIVPIGAPALSDPVDLTMAAGAEIAISLYLPQTTLPETYHRPSNPVEVVGTASSSGPEAQVSGPGDHTRDVEMPGAAPSPRLFVSRVDIAPAKPAGAIVVLGTTRQEGDGRWPDILQKRLAAAGRPLAVVNASMVANPLTHPYPGGGEAALARYDRDVLLIPSARYVILADAANDIGQAGGLVPLALPSADDLIAAYRQLTMRARAQGLKVIATTMMPMAGAPFPNFYSPEKEKLRGEVNAWIRTGGAFDAVIDMDAIVRDPADPLRFAKGLDSANHFTPSLAGEQKLGAAIDLKLFR